MKYALILITVVFGVLRFIVPVTGTINNADFFKDMAHIWVGFLFGVAAIKSQHPDEWFAVELFPFGPTGRINLWWLLPVSLTVLEVVAFIVRRS